MGVVSKVGKACLEAACLHVSEEHRDRLGPPVVKRSRTLLRQKLNAFISFLVTGF